MKSLFYYLLAIALATSSLVAGPKPEPKNPFTLSGRVDSEDELRHSTFRDQYDRIVDSDSLCQERSPSATAPITESKSLLSLDLTADIDTDSNMSFDFSTASFSDSVAVPDLSREVTSAISSQSQAGITINSYASAQLGHQIRAVPTLTSAQKRAQARLDSAQKSLQQSSAIVASVTQPNSKLRFLSSLVSQVVSSFFNPKIEAAIQEVETAATAVEKAKEKAPTAAPHPPEDQLINSDTKIIIFGDPEYDEASKKEDISLISSVLFGATRCQQIEEKEQKALVQKLCNKEKDPFAEFQRDLTRATFELTDEKGQNISFSVVSDPQGSVSRQRLANILSFIGENQHLRIAITSLMYQRGSATLEILQLDLSPEENGARPENTWKLNPTGPLQMQLMNAGRNPKTEYPTYHLEKNISNGKTTFNLTIKVTRTNQLRDLNIDHHVASFLTYEFEENNRFEREQPISADNLPVTIRCLDGGIVRTFDDKRSTEQLELQQAEYNLALAQERNEDFAPVIARRNIAAAQYNLTVYQRRLEGLGDPHQIETEYQQRIQFLAGRAATRPGSIMTQDRNEAEAKLQALRQAQQDVARAQETLRDAQHLLNTSSENATDSDERDSQPGFSDDTDDEH